MRSTRKRNLPAVQRLRRLRRLSGLLARSDIDAVAIVVPDHWHGLMTVMAAQAGKDIYCEKPLSLSIRQGQAMVRAVREHKRILQTGSHYVRALPIASRASWCATAGSARSSASSRKSPRTTRSIRAGLAAHAGAGGVRLRDVARPCPQVPYHKDRCLYRFRFNLDYSGGQVTNFGAHSSDIAQWGMGTDGTGPSRSKTRGRVGLRRAGCTTQPPR